MYGLQSFTVSDFYQTVNNPGGIEGNATGFWVAALIRIDTQGLSSTTRTFFSRHTTVAAGGWSLATSGAHAQLGFFSVDGAGGTSGTPLYSVSASDVGKVLHVVGVREPARLRLYVNKGQVAAGVAITGYTPASERTQFGRRVAGNPTSGATLFGGCGGVGIPTLAEIQAQADAVKLAGDILAIPGKTDSLWSVKQDQAGTAPALLDDKIGSEDMQIQGAPTLVQVTNPVWGW